MKQSTTFLILKNLLETLASSRSFILVPFDVAKIQ